MKEVKVKRRGIAPDVHLYGYCRQRLYGLELDDTEVITITLYDVNLPALKQYLKRHGYEYEVKR